MARYDDLKLDEARLLIRQRRYAEARRLLSAMPNNQQARQLLDKLDNRAQPAPRHNPTQPTTVIEYRIFGRQLPIIPFVIVLLILLSQPIGVLIILIAVGVNPAIAILLAVIGYALTVLYLLVLWRFFWWVLMIQALLWLLGFLWLLAIGNTFLFPAFNEFAAFQRDAFALNRDMGITMEDLLNEIQNAPPLVPGG